MTKKEEERLREYVKVLEDTVAKLDERNRELMNAKDDDFTGSIVYNEMKRELLLADTLKDWEGRLRRKIYMDEAALSEYKKIIADNRELCKEHGVEYWVGIAGKSKWDELEAQKAEREIRELKAALEAKDAVIAHLKTVAAGGDPSPAATSHVGRPAKIDEATKKRILKLRREGWSMKQIADSEGVSKGSVARIVAEAAKKAIK